MTALRKLATLPHLVPLRRIAEDYPWIHAGLGLAGNTTFFVGSIFFLFTGLRVAGTWLFILGSFGMLVDTVGEILLRLEGYAEAAER